MAGELFAGLMVIGIIAGHLAGIRLNTTQSLPPGFYQFIPSSLEQIERGAIVMACPEYSEIQREARARGYLHYGLACPGVFAPLFKRVMALPGDYVTVTRDGITVNEHPVANTGRLMADSQGRALPPLPTSGIVPSGMVWLLSDYAPRSYDSRYFGPVPASTVYGLARPVWTFD